MTDNTMADAEAFGALVGIVDAILSCDDAQAQIALGLADFSSPEMQAGLVNAQFLLITHLIGWCAARTDVPARDLWRQVVDELRERARLEVEKDE